MNNTGTAMLRQPQLLYANSITTRGSETTNDDGLQSAGTLAGMFILAREHRNHTKQASNQARPANWHDTPGQYIECTCKLTINQKQSRQTTTWH